LVYILNTIIDRCLSGKWKLFHYSIWYD